MGYLERENAIIQKLQASHYAIFDGNKEEALDFLDKQLSYFPEYANAVIMQQHKLPLIYARYEGEELQDRVQTLDRQRRNIHECAIDSVNILNRLSKNLGLEPFSTVDTSDRHAVADMVGDYIAEMYKTGTHGMDGATFKRETSYDTRLLEERRRKAARACENIQEPDGDGLSYEI